MEGTDSAGAAGLNSQTGTKFGIQPMMTQWTMRICASIRARHLQGLKSNKFEDQRYFEQQLRNVEREIEGCDGILKRLTKRFAHYVAHRARSRASRGEFGCIVIGR